MSTEAVECSWCPAIVDATVSVIDKDGDIFCSQLCYNQYCGDYDGDHADDSGNPCDCSAQECGLNGSCPVCGEGKDIDPESLEKSDKLELVCGDHGYRCYACNTTFTCP